MDYEDTTWELTPEKATALAASRLGLEIGERIAEEIVDHSARSSKSPQGDATVRQIFKTLIGPLSSLEKGLFWNQMSTATTTEFLETFRGTRDSILEAKPTIDEVAPDIASNLFELINLLDEGTGGTSEDSTFRDVCSNNSSVLPLVSSLTRRIELWLSEHS